MFLLTPGFRFLDIINYLGPGTSYEKWKAFECTTENSWFPYEWFDGPEKLHYPGLPGLSSHPFSRPLANRQPHFNSVLVAEQAFSQRAVKPFNNCLVTVNFSAPASNRGFVSFHIFGKSANKLSSRINLQQ